MPRRREHKEMNFWNGVVCFFFSCAPHLLVPCQIFLKTWRTACKRSKKIFLEAFVSKNCQNSLKCSHWRKKQGRNETAHSMQLSNTAYKKPCSKACLIVTSPVLSCELYLLLKEIASVHMGWILLNCTFSGHSEGLRDCSTHQLSLVAEKELLPQLSHNFPSLKHFLACYCVHFQTPKERTGLVYEIQFSGRPITEGVTLCPA